MRRLLNFPKLTRPDTLHIIVEYSGDNPSDVQHEIYDTRGCHVMFVFLERFYKYDLDVTLEVDDVDAQVAHYRVCVVRHTSCI